MVQNVWKESGKFFPTIFLKDLRKSWVFESLNSVSSYLITNARHDCAFIPFYSQKLKLFTQFEGFRVFIENLDVCTEFSELDIFWELSGLYSIQIFALAHLTLEGFAGFDRLGRKHFISAVILIYSTIFSFNCHTKVKTDIVGFSSSTWASERDDDGIPCGARDCSP